MFIVQIKYYCELVISSLTGLLEQPGFPSEITPTIVPFKLLLLGKSAVGKTSTVTKLAGKG